MKLGFIFFLTHFLKWCSNSCSNYSIPKCFLTSTRNVFSLAPKQSKADSRLLPLTCGRKRWPLFHHNRSSATLSGYLVFPHHGKSLCLHSNIRRDYGYVSGHRVCFKVVSENLQPVAALSDEAFTSVVPAGIYKTNCTHQKPAGGAGQCSAGATVHSCIGVLPKQKHFHTGFSSKRTQTTFVILMLYATELWL